MDAEICAVPLEEDPISIFFDLKECPQVLNLPTDVNPVTGEVIRPGKEFMLEEVMDEYDQSVVPLKKLLDEVFYDLGKVKPHERILCWFPKYLEYFLKT